MKSAYDKIAAGLEDAIAYAKGEPGKAGVAATGASVGMTHADFSIGLEFMMSGSRWRCTDVGTRTIVAIKLDAPDDSWYAGPPYAVAEMVIDENDIEACEPI